MLNSSLKEILWYLIKQKNYGYFNFIFNIFQSQLFIFPIYHKNSFIFVISMVDLVEIDVYMSHIVKMKFRTSTTSSGFVLGPTKTYPATFLFILWCRRRIGDNLTDEVVESVVNELLFTGLCLEIRTKVTKTVTNE